MIKDLKTTSENLHVALEQYLRVCNGLFTLSSQGYVLSTLSEEDTQQVNTELASISSYEERVREARLTMTRARNRLFSFSPINSLPSEVLTHIFEMVVVSQPCVMTTCYDEASINRDYAYPDLLMSVCSRWRHIVESHPSLWVHIDFVPDSGQAKLISRAKTYAKRAQKKPLEIHIAGAEGAEYSYHDLVQLLESLAGRMKALEIFVAEEDIGEFYPLVLEKLLPKSRPTTFTRFSLRSQREHNNIFIIPSRSSQYGGQRVSSFIPVNLSQEILERSFAPLKSLDLCAIFPGWKSKAYHGLVELRLTSSMDELFSQIPEQDLIAILKASPGLRVLHFAIDIINQQKGSTLNGTVILKDLEELEISSSYEFQMRYKLKVGNLLRLLTPGNKPLSLMLQTMDYEPGASWEATKSFLARSNVTRFHAKTGAPLIDELLRRMPHLTDLIFSRLSALGPAAEGITLDALNRAIKDAATVKYPLSSLTVRDCPTYLDRLRLMVELCPTKSLTFCDCVFWENEEARKPMDDAQVAQLLSLFPAIKIVKKEKSPRKSDLAPVYASNSDSDLEL
ncbi:unnamed protein product [Rhizoctonia solani]|uniref:F-box domain-containing protein n=1 Tax=Rhizoctonia solani TaxID=456999 RepID=A0A8H3HBT1_9AGAM|nr:unnamed protein product [Rhizoctonia solani]